MLTRDQKLHAQPIQFTSPLFINQSGSKQNYSRVAFETDLPRVETNTNPPCQRHISIPQIRTLAKAALIRPSEPPSIPSIALRKVSTAASGK